MCDAEETKRGLVDELAKLRNQIVDREAKLVDCKVNEAKWRSMVGNAPVFVVQVGEADTIQFLNRAAPGMSVEAAIGKTVYDYLQPEFVTQARESIARVRRTGETTSYECLAAGPNGTLAWYETHVGPVLVDDKIVAVSLIAIDITARKRVAKALEDARADLERQVEQRTAELRESNEQLRQSEARYRALVESSPDAVIMMDLEGRLQFVSRQAMQLHGAADPQELVGHFASEFVIEQERERLQQNLRLLVEQGVRENKEYTCLRRDGTTYPAESSSAVIRNDAGAPVALMAVYRDISEHKEAQQALLRMVRASDRERELITYEIHDGVAQRLLGALMHFEAVAETNGAVPTQARAKFQAGLAALRQASAEARSLMNRTRTPVFQEFGIAAAIADYVEQLGAGRSGPEITFQCDTEFERLDPLLENTLFRIAQEALVNACRHGQCEVIRVTLAQDGDELTLDVQDDGVGFDPAAVKEGDFGLAGIRERARLLGKELRIESAPGQGTRIRATFRLT